VDDLSKLKESIMNDMKQIWEEIPKPEAFKDKPCSEFFRFEFLTLAHKFYKEKEFNEGINLIKQRLKREKDDNRTGDNPDSIFNLVNYDKNVPIDGFYKYSLDIWTSILNNKDLNIPGQKEMLARFKCDEIKLMALNAVDEKINDLDLASSSEILNDFNERVNAILKEALDNYDPLAKNYLPHIYQDVRKTLQTELANKLYSSFSNQLKRLIPKYQKEFRNEFEQQLRQNENFMEVSEKLKKKYVEKLGEELGKLKVFNDWDTGKDSEVIFNEIIENQRNICLEEKKEKLIEQFIELIEETIVNKFELVTNNFWVEFQQEIFLLVSQNLLAQKERLAQIYKITDEEYINFVDDCENEIYSKIRTLFFNELPGFPNTQIDNFKKDFWYNDGIPKVWNTVSVSDINLAFQANSSKYKDSFEILRKLRVIKNPLKMCDYGQKPKEEIETFEKETIEQIINDPFTEFETLLDDDTLQKYIVKYEEGIKDIYDEAMRRHENIISTRIPLWAWALLIYISYDDIWKMITGHWLLMLLLASGIFALFRVLNMVGLGNAPQMLFNTIQNQLKMLTNKNKIN
jgi:hemerythrin-like domain-containing protein